MKKKYHLSENGPALCRASVRDCPIGGEHFDSIEKAEREYSKTMEDIRIPKSLNKAFTMKVSKTTGDIIQKLNDNGMKALIVGGSVRDQFLGLDNKDIDVEVYGSKNNGESLDYSSIKDVFKKSSGYKIDEAGASFSVLKLRRNGEDFDISLPRTEQTTGEGHKDYNIQHDSRLDFSEAASRRDFTINSMAYDYISGKLIDPYGGAEDIKNKTLRHISDAFSDDPLRCMRAVNFASRFDFDVHPDTVQLCRKLSNSYNSLARERIEEEFNKLFYKGNHCDKGFKVLHDIGWAEKMPPFKNVPSETLANYGIKLNKINGGLERKALLSYQMRTDGHQDPTDFLESSVSNRKIIKGTVNFLNSLKSNDRALVVKTHRDLKNIYNISNSELNKIAKIANINYDVEDNLPEEPREPIVTGKKLIDLGYKPGPDMGKIINKAQYFQDRDDLTSFSELLRLASK